MIMIIYKTPHRYQKSKFIHASKGPKVELILKQNNRLIAIFDRSNGKMIYKCSDYRLHQAQLKRRIIKTFKSLISKLEYQNLIKIV